ncbi:glycosyltransferase family 2 protein [Synechococcus sp. MW101C3]|uniref:glycosyltransferase family 2 protein n=1 Tax=Synechococcus sp. MW101C3 TaxID=210768 RepID=UPI000B97CDDD|nr:glycosyltransferase family 2 protein [Synechococcus sp. MW101C3]
MASTPVSQPRVSVLIPTYNGGDWLLDAIRSSVDRQSVSVEVIVVDDASTDDTSERVARSFPEVQLIRQPCNSGSGARGRNTGLEHARGDYVKFLDHDDLLEPETLPLEVAAADAESADMVMCRWGDVRTDPQGSLIEATRRVFIPPAPDRLVEAILLDEKVPYTAGVLYRRTYIADQRWDARLTINDDFDWFCRNALRGGRIIRLDHVSYYWRLHSQSIQGRQGANRMSFLEAVYIRSHVYSQVMDSLLLAGGMTPERGRLLVRQLYSGLRCLARFDTAACQKVLQRIQQLEPRFQLDETCEPNRTIRAVVSVLGLRRWLGVYRTLKIPQDRLCPLQGRVEFFTNS